MQSLENYIQELNKQFVDVIGGSFCMVSTGELFTKAEVQKYVQSKLEIYQAQVFNQNKDTIESSCGIRVEQRLVNSRSKKPIKKQNQNKATYLKDNNTEFNIVHRNKIKEVSNMQLDKNEKLVYYVLRDFIQHPSNCVMINGEVPRLKDLENLVSLTERKIRDCLKSLEKKNLLKLVQSGHRKAIYINPEYYATGKELNITTLALFGLVEIDQEKVDGYVSPPVK